MMTSMSVCLSFGYDLLDFNNIQASVLSILVIMFATISTLAFFKVNSKAYDDFFEEIKKNFLL
jgi:hypothetical protein